MAREWNKREADDWPPPIDSLPLTKEQLRSIVLSDEDMDVIEWEEEEEEGGAKRGGNETYDCGDDDKETEEEYIKHDCILENYFSRTERKTPTTFYSLSDASLSLHSADDDDDDDEELDEEESNLGEEASSIAPKFSDGLPCSSGRGGSPQTSESHFNKSSSSECFGEGTTTRAVQAHSVIFSGG